MATTFDRKIWSMMVLDQLDKNLIASAITTTKYAQSPNASSVDIFNPGSVTVGNYTRGTAMDTQYPTDATINVALDQEKYYNTLIEDVDEMLTDVSLMSAYADRASYQIADVIDTYVLAQATAGAGSSIDIAATVITKANIEATIFQPAMDALEAANVPRIGRYIVLPTWSASMLQSLEIDKSNKGIINSNYVGNTYGFDVYISNNLVAGTGDGHKVIAGSTEATYWGLALNKTDVISDKDYFGEIIRGLFKYGSDVVLAGALVTFNNTNNV